MINRPGPFLTPLFYLKMASAGGRQARFPAQTLAVRRFRYPEKGRADEALLN